MPYLFFYVCLFHFSCTWYFSAIYIGKLHFSLVNLLFLIPKLASSGLYPATSVKITTTFLIVNNALIVKQKSCHNLFVVSHWHWQHFLSRIHSLLFQQRSIHICQLPAASCKLPASTCLALYQYVLYQ